MFSKMMTTYLFMFLYLKYLALPLALPPPPTLTPTTVTTSTVITTTTKVTPPVVTKVPTTKLTTATTTTAITTARTTKIFEPVEETTTTTTTTQKPTTTLEPVTNPEPTKSPDSTTITDPITTTITTTTPDPTTTTTTTSTQYYFGLPCHTITPITTPSRQCISNLVPFNDAIGLGLTSGESYVEYTVETGRLNRRSGYEFYVYTLETDGLLLSTNMKTSYDYEVVYMLDGKVYYLFNAGAGDLELSSFEKVNDGKLHLIKVSRVKKDGYLTVDKNEVMRGTAPGYSTEVNHIETIFVGGLPDEEKRSQMIPKQSRVSLRGGIVTFQLFNEAIVPEKKVGTGPGYNGLPFINALSFGTEGGYVEKYKSFAVKQKCTISFDVRSRNKTGTLFHAVGKNDFLTITIEENGSLKAECNNGGGRFSVVIMSETSICDGEFHSVRLEKDKQTLRLSLNGKTKQVTSTKTSSSAETNSPAYFGGLPSKLRPKGYKPFVGCLNKATLNGEFIWTTGEVLKTGAVMNGCPK